MDLKWHNPEATFDTLVLAGDIGGTNTNLALVGVTGSKFTIVLETVFASNQIDGLEAPIRETLDAARARRADLVPSRACISGAGPVAGNVCVMTNLSWTIDGNALAQSFAIPFAVINDFLAISYGIPTLDVNNPEQILVLAHPDGSQPAPQLATKAVVGPGTGLGVSFLVWDGQRHIPASSEGGHIQYAPFDNDTQSFRDWLEAKLGAVPGVEPLVSGTGIGNLYSWWSETKELPATELWASIAAMPASDRPRAISTAAESDETARAMMNLFSRMLGRYCGDVASMLLPLGGLYLAGGVAQKGLHWLLPEHAFATAFENSYNPNLRNLLRQVPLYLIRDYSISLYGAANGALQLLP
jgi:glucokinase